MRIKTGHFNMRQTSSSTLLINSNPQIQTLLFYLRRYLRFFILKTTALFVNLTKLSEHTDHMSKTSNNFNIR